MNAWADVVFQLPGGIGVALDGDDDDERMELLMMFVAMIGAQLLELML
jgi:hypothetical protein